MSDLAPGYGRFVALEEFDAPHLVARRAAGEIPVDGERYGIYSRLLARPGVTIVDLAEAVCQKLMREQALLPRDLGLVLSSRSWEIERLAQELASRLGVGGEAHGIERACSGFPAATALAAELYRQTERPVLLVTSEIMSQYINWEPPVGDAADHRRARGQAARLFGDGAAAVLVHGRSRSTGHAILDAWADEIPDDDELLQKLPVAESLDVWGQIRPGVTDCLAMPGRRGVLLLRRAPGVMVDAVHQSLARARIRGQAGLSEEIADVVPHQANGLMFEALELLVRAHSWGGHTRVWNCIRDWGNTTSATIPLALASIQSRMTPGGLVALPTVGAGGPGYRPQRLSRGCVLMRTAGV